MHTARTVVIGLFAPCIKAPCHALFRWNLSRVSALLLRIDTQPGGRNINPTRCCGASTQLGQPNEWPRGAVGTVVLHLKSHRTERVGHHGYPDTSHHYCSCSSPWRSRLVRPGTLVLGGTQGAVADQLEFNDAAQRHDPIRSCGQVITIQMPKSSRSASGLTLVRK